MSPVSALNGSTWLYRWTSAHGPTTVIRASASDGKVCPEPVIQHGVNECPSWFETGHWPRLPQGGPKFNPRRSSRTRRQERPNLWLPNSFLSQSCKRCCDLKI